MNNTEKMNDLLPVLGCWQVVLDGILLLFSFVSGLSDPQPPLNLWLFLCTSQFPVFQRRKEEKKRKLSCRLVFEGESLELFLDSELELLW